MLNRTLLVLSLWLLALAPAAAQTTGPWSKVVFGTDAGPFDTSGTSSPENVIVACPGSTYRQTDGAAGNVLWVKDGATGCDATGWIILAGGGGGGSHNLLSATHSDTQANAAVRSAVVVGNSTPAWARLTPTTTGQVLRFNGTDSLWSLDGSLLQDLNATELTSGTLPDARLSANVSLFGAAVDSAEITDGTVTFADWASNSCASNQIPKWNGSAWACAADEDSGGGGSAPADASYWTSTAEAGLSNETDLGALTTGLLKHTVTAGVSTPATATAGTDYVTPAGAETLTNKTLGSTLAITAAPTLSDGVTWTFNPDATSAGLNVGSHAGDPSAPANGDLWYDSTANELTARINGVDVALGAGGGGGACQEGEYDTAHSGATLTVDWDNGAQQIVDLDVNLTSLTLSNGVNGCTYRLIFVQDAGGTNTVTWPSGVEFENSVDPTFDTSANNVTYCALVKTAVGAGGYLGFCTENPIAQP